MFVGFWLAIWLQVKRMPEVGDEGAWFAEVQWVLEQSDYDVTIDWCPDRWRRCYRQGRTPAEAVEVMRVDHIMVTLGPAAEQWQPGKRNS